MLPLTLSQRGKLMTDPKLPKLTQAIRTDALTVTLTGKDSILVETAAGHKITVQGNNQGVVIEDGSGDSIQLQGGSIQIRAAGQVSIQCSTANISASSITVNAPMTTFSGTVQADTVIANSVVAASYSPGAGNVW